MIILWYDSPALTPKSEFSDENHQIVALINDNKQTCTLYTLQQTHYYTLQQMQAPSSKVKLSDESTNTSACG